MSAPSETVERARRADVTFVAAAVAYYWLGSLVPVAVLAFVVVQVAYGSVLADWSVQQLEIALTPAGQDLLHRALLDSTGATGLGVVGTVGLLWGWSRLYRALESAFERVYETDHEESLPARALAACVVVPAICIGMALAAAGVVSTFTGVVWDALLVVAVAFALFPVFVTLPPERPGLRAAVAGSIATAVAWSLLRYAFDLYATYGTFSLAYDLLGGVIFVLTFLYLGALALLVAVSLTATLDS
ncbi:hypothetical protein G9C85_03355 [Halorubellus sp. JP-L1]|uniref:YihY/virulence factor BrkB family protein n=1 Tax=Halorubellus sp. JP-L1 TaxID=2715753 RepID=UPI00140C62FD|nr:hypothetical protein [Halorubellus sp. JP-L1]